MNNNNRRIFSFTNTRIRCTILFVPPFYDHFSCNKSPERNKNIKLTLDHTLFYLYLFPVPSNTTMFSLFLCFLQKERNIFSLYQVFFFSFLLPKNFFFSPCHIIFPSLFTLRNNYLWPGSFFSACLSSYSISLVKKSFYCSYWGTDTKYSI